VTLRARAAGALRLAAAYVGTALLFALLTVRLTARGTSLVVPALAGLDVKQVKQTLAAQGLELAVTGEEWSDAAPAGCVIAQAPAAGARVKRGRRVKLTIPKGSEVLAIPALRDPKLEDSEFLLRQLGLEISSLGTVPSALPRRQVIAQSPLPAARVNRGSSVQILVSDGPAPAAFAVPRVTGLPTREALARLRDAGLRIAEVAYETATAFADGVVLAQDPPGGYRALAGEEARLRAARTGSAGGLVRYAAFTFTVPAGAARRVRTLIVDEAGSREVGNEMEEGGSVLRFATQVQGEAVVQFFISGTLVEERRL